MLFSYTLLLYTTRKNYDFYDVIDLQRFTKVKSNRNHKNLNNPIVFYC